MLSFRLTARLPLFVRGHTKVLWPNNRTVGGKNAITAPWVFRNSVGRPILHHDDDDNDDDDS